jgi:hypothetical protein
LSNEKWAESLSEQCGVDPKFLKYALEELSESCHADTATAKDLIEELTLSCGFHEEDLKKFVDQVSKNCPLDVKKLYREVLDASGKKEEAFNAINRVTGKTI